MLAFYWDVQLYNTHAGLQPIVLRPKGLIQLLKLISLDAFQRKIPKLLYLELSMKYASKHIFSFVRSGTFEKKALNATGAGSLETRP